MRRPASGVVEQIVGTKDAASYGIVNGPSEIEAIVAGQPTSFELAFRVVRRLPMKSLTSWSVFEVSDDAFIHPGGCLIRKATWNREYLRLREEDHDPLDSVNSSLRFVSAMNAQSIEARLLSLDAALGQAHFEKGAEWEAGDHWEEISLFRFLDWGTVDISWNSSVLNKNWEEQASRVEEQIESLIAPPGIDLIQSLQLRYYDTQYGYLAQHPDGV